VTFNRWGKEEARESGEGEETHGSRERKEAEKQGKVGQTSSICQKKEEEVGIVKCQWPLC
jgi:hypothetical protein